MNLPIRLLLCAAASAVVYWGSGKIDELAAMQLPFTIVTTGTLWIKVLSPYLLELPLAIRRKAISDACEPWNGRYYAFDNRQIRLYLIDGVIWVPQRASCACWAPTMAPSRARPSCRAIPKRACCVC
jgi:hypothetical protein